MVYLFPKHMSPMRYVAMGVRGGEQQRYVAMGVRGGERQLFVFAIAIREVQTSSNYL